METRIAEVHQTLTLTGVVRPHGLQPEPRGIGIWRLIFINDEEYRKGDTLVS